MTYIDKLLERGSQFHVRRSEGSASFTPFSGRDEDIQTFQKIVADLRQNDGDGYMIHHEHVISERKGEFVDLVVVTLVS